MKEGLKIAVIGGGVAGIVSSYLLQQKHNVTLFEKNSYLGGHTNTITIESGPDAGAAVDTGFIVLNNKTYPLFNKFLASLDVGIRDSDMSFSYHDKLNNFLYAGTNLNGLFAQRFNIIRPGFYKFLFEINRFCKICHKYLLMEGTEEITLKDFLEKHSFKRSFAQNYLIPMAAAIWSAPDNKILNFPAMNLIKFFNNHGLLSLIDRPTWQTVIGGSHSYVKAFAESFTGKILLDSPIEQVSRREDKVIILTKEKKLEFDKVILASHADQSLRMLEDPSQEEKELLGAWKYQKNPTVLHTDTSLLPSKKCAWASWNYQRTSESSHELPVHVTYYMNLLQGLKTKEHYCVTLNQTKAIDPSKIIKEIEYHHPVYSVEAVKTQEKLPNLNGKSNTYYCGSYFKHGFHEDAVRSAVEVGRLFDCYL